LGALKHFLANVQGRENAQKRGGAHTLVSWEHDLEEGPLTIDPMDSDTPDRVFDRRWALAIIEQALARLEEEEAAMDRGAHYCVLKEYLTGRCEDPSYATSAKQLGISESAVKSAIHRLRRRYAQVLREEVARTVSGPEEIDDEIRNLLAAVSAQARS
jgi:RNA polymerase sigma-70 factor (ECF subfamily)